MQSAQPSILFSGSSNKELSSKLAQQLQTSLGNLSIDTFPDGETKVELLERVQGADTFILQSIAKEPNHYLMELLIIVDALKRAAAKNICAVIPYCGYARQDRNSGMQTPITAKLVANLLQAAGVHQVVTIDLHTDQMEGFFEMPLHHLRAADVFVAALKQEQLHSMVVISPDFGSHKMAKRLAKKLGSELAILDKTRGGLAVHPNSLLGEVNGKSAIIVDDVCSTGATLSCAARACLDNGATEVYAVVTHWLCPEEEIKGIKKIFTTDSTAREKALEQGKGAPHRLSIAPLLASAIGPAFSEGMIGSIHETI